MIGDEGNDPGDALIDLEDLILQGADFRGVVFVGCIGIAVRYKAGDSDGLFAFDGHLFHDSADGVLQALQTRRTAAGRLAGIIALLCTVAVLSAVIQRHEAIADGAVDEAGQRIHLPCIVDGGGCFRLIPKGADALPFFLGKDGRNAARDADRLRRCDAVARIRADAADIGAGIDLIFQHEVEIRLSESSFPGGRKGKAVEIVEDGGIAAAGQVHLEDPAGDRGGGWIQLIMFFGVDTIAEGDMAAQILAFPGEMLMGHDDAIRILFPLQLGERSKEIEHHPPGRGGCVDGFGDGDQGNVPGLEDVLDDGKRIPERAGKPVQLPDHDSGHRLRPAVGQQLLQCRAVCVLSGKAGILIDFDLLGCHGGIAFENATLGLDGDTVRGLLFGRHAGITQDN